ncbi:MAG: dihydropteroate synthase [Deltaproteobacteria bacterium]|nr:dihydropteroate synthase [Deltaproteobacteria bacterium]
MVHFFAISLTEKPLKFPVRFLDIRAVERAWREMERIGVDPAGIRIMAPKQFHYNLRVEGLTPAQANVLKQDMLSIGAEAAVAKGAASCSVGSTDALLSGTARQFEATIDKLSVQSFGLPEVGLSLAEAIGNLNKRSYIVKGGGREWEFGPRTMIMGILNVTPDSFSDGGRFIERGRAVERGLEMFEEGADFIDVGGESTRPGALPVGVAEEMDRVVPVVEAIASKRVPVSIDTTKAEVARAALVAGAGMVNDVSALGMDAAMAGVCAEFKAAVVLMHMRGTPSTMQEDTVYKDLVSEVYNHLMARMDYAVSSGIERESIIIDPGIGFGKSSEGNLELIRNLREFRTLGAPILLGPSRKSFIGAALGARVEDRLMGTIAAAVAAALNGASVLRVHDVKEARMALNMADAIRGGV